MVCSVKALVVSVQTWSHKWKLPLTMNDMVQTVSARPCIGMLSNGRRFSTLCRNYVAVSTSAM